ncbi:MAG: caspase family protein [Odoribacter sp.]|nr:caspase family protein [Odoribacter sp.]
MKRILSLSLCMLVALVTVAQRFDYTYKGVNFKCKVVDGSVCITSFNANAVEVVIPAQVTYKGGSYPVKQVSTFLNGVNYLAVSLTLEEGIEDIDKFSFNEFRKLTSVKLPASVRHIGKNAFRDNPGLALTMSAGVDENALRQGRELWTTGQGEMIAANSSKPTAQEEKEIAETKKKEEKKEQPQEEPKAEKEETAKKGFKDRYLELLAEKMANSAVKKQEKIQQKEQEKTPRNTPAAPSAMEVAANEPVLAPVDVDMNIPVVASDRNNNTYCVIIANENYKDVPEVDYALRDGEIFREYCIKTFGIPEKQIRMFPDASYTDIKRALNWAETMANVTEGKSKILFYYAGHGMPDEKDKTAYLIPTDGFPKDISTCFKLSELYGRLAKMQTQSVTVLLDACFSGVKRGSGQALVAARGIAIKPKNEVLGGNMVVFTAASDDETALSYQEKRHGMFTYFLLDQLKKSKGKVTFGDLFSTLSSEVKKNSMLENDKLQTPSVNVSDNLKSKWKELQF